MAGSPVPLGEVFAGKYRVDRVLGEGGMGVVVAAHHLELDQPVAIKFLLDELSSNAEGAERFRREARAAAKIQSDHVVRVLDVGVAEGVGRYMVMEFLNGKDLSEELQEVGQLPVGLAVAYMLEAFDAVDHAHAVGIVHRDLKPANLFLAKRPDGSVRVKVLDFGISKTFGAASQAELSLTKTSAWIGSPLYMSPEQMQSARDVDHRTDIWSLGAIFYELLTGRPPYVADSLPQLCNLLLTQDPEPVQTRRPDVPVELAAILMSALVRDREARAQSVAELALALAPFAGPFAGQRMSRRLLPSVLDRTELGPAPLAASGARSSLPTVTPALGSSGVSAETVSGHVATVAPGVERKKLGWVLGLAALGLVGAGLAWGLGRPESEEPLAPAAAPEDATNAAPLEVSKPEPPPSPDAKSVGAPPGGASPAGEPVAGDPAEDAAPPEPAKSGAGAPVKTSAAKPPTPSTSKPGSTKKGDPPSTPPSKPPANDDFSEFGGRR